MKFEDKMSVIVPLLRENGVILHATDTVWGLAASAFSKEGINKIYDIKNRDRSKPLLLLVSDLSMLKAYIEDIHPRIETLLSYHTRPLTVIYDNVINIPDHALAPDGTVGIRIVKDEFCRSLIKALGHPIVSTSANISGEQIPEKLDEISVKIKNAVDHIADHRSDESLIAEPSVIIRYNHKGHIDFIRS